MFDAEIAIEAAPGLRGARSPHDGKRGKGRERMLRYQPYVRRAICPNPPIAIGEWRFKLYSIDWQRAQAITPEQRRAVERVIQRNIRHLEREPHHHAGFVIVHRDPEETWLLVNWWAHGSIIGQLMFRADRASTMDFERVTQPFVACIWEMVPLAFERDAWVDLALRQDGQVDAYMDRSLPSGLY